MNPPPENFSHSEKELVVLRAMCQEAPQGSGREAALRALKDYQWHEPVHQAIFHCLSRFPSANLDLLRSELPACLTRQGFPDVDWNAFFSPHSVTREDAERAMGALNGGG